MKVKSIEEILKALHNGGYKLESDGIFRHNNKVAFSPEMFAYCGEESGGKWTWRPEWLVPEEQEPEIGSWCKFWDRGAEPPMSQSRIGILTKINVDEEYPCTEEDGTFYRYCKQLKGSLEDTE